MAEQEKNTPAETCKFRWRIHPFGGDEYIIFLWWGEVPAREFNRRVLRISERGYREWLAIERASDFWEATLPVPMGMVAMTLGLLALAAERYSPAAKLFIESPIGTTLLASVTLMAVLSIILPVVRICVDQRLKKKLLRAELGVQVAPELIRTIHDPIRGGMYILIPQSVMDEREYTRRC
ncbi:hypothetical protein A3D71_01335 [Candidatus Kaiserbacteria bacterium RIFCSPHIGHO2_02_FULL_55_20]|uniref:Uncharacterized protein n=1 Tax=Candidatus Kaiserbacteria bacterium RIFCSPHIGHO2_02_FULL_55_20 TaxID=1798497 RepID=A0A1F6DYQ6_9BACT|nr:MAG: hypothetical protein A2680_03440 [Candidatus Kaiserbacteria bacterium RIFCSPHIGHO2_01_FULL_55_37]OGG66142.1 MAG: hypothetical protein A3D71_01335 [Candidatus Kaiserbacteria bacterium RIFCSPHIGHO2_02_FULL_55_20]